MEPTGKRVDVYFVGDAPKLTGLVVEWNQSGLLIDTGSDGTALAYAIATTFVPFSAVRHVHFLRERSDAEQQAKRREIEERFKRQKLEALGAHTKEAELLSREDDDDQ